MFPSSRPDCAVTSQPSLGNCGPAAAQVVCGDRENFVEHLAEGFEEAPTAFGVVDSGSILEVLVSPTGSWSILVTSPAGLTCMIASGQSWETLPVLEGGPAA